MMYSTKENNIRPQNSTEIKTVISENFQDNVVIAMTLARPGEKMGHFLINLGYLQSGPEKMKAK